MPVSCARSIYSKFPELATDLEEHRQGLTLLKDSEECSCCAPRSYFTPAKGLERLTLASPWAHRLRVHCCAVCLRPWWTKTFWRDVRASCPDLWGTWPFCWTGRSRLVAVGRDLRASEGLKALRSAGSSEVYPLLHPPGAEAARWGAQLWAGHREAQRLQQALLDLLGEHLLPELQVVTSAGPGTS